MIYRAHRAVLSLLPVWLSALVPAWLERIDIQLVRIMLYRSKRLDNRQYVYNPKEIELLVDKKKKDNMFTDLPDTAALLTSS